MAWNVVTATRTASGLTREQWVRSRHSVAYENLRARGIDPYIAWWIAATLVAQWARETGNGRNEWDCAEGNIRATAAWSGDVHYLRGHDDAQPAPYRAYPHDVNCETGVADAIRLALDGERYHGAYLRLLASAHGGPYAVGPSSARVAIPLDATNWYFGVMQAGWSTPSQEAVDEYRSIVGTVARIVGAVPYTESVAGKVAIGVGVVTLGGALWWAFGKR